MGASPDSGQHLQELYGVFEKEGDIDSGLCKIV